MQTRALDGAACWQCGSRHGSATNIARSEPLQVGDIAICPRCSAVSIVEEVNGAFSVRAPNTMGADAWLIEDADLLTFLFVRMMYATGLAPRKCPQCEAPTLVVGKDGQAPKFMDEVQCDCGAQLRLKADLSLGPREE